MPIAGAMAGFAVEELLAFHSARGGSGCGPGWACASGSQSKAARASPWRWMRRVRREKVEPDIASPRTWREAAETRGWAGY